MTARLLMIALDAADGRLVEEWSAAGALPNLAALGARGAVKRLNTPGVVSLEDFSQLADRVLDGASAN